jgi:hypothetical protein
MIRQQLSRRPLSGFTGRRRRTETNVMRPCSLHCPHDCCSVALLTELVCIGPVASAGDCGLWGWPSCCPAIGVGRAPSDLHMLVMLRPIDGMKLSPFEPQIYATQAGLAGRLAWTVDVQHAMLTAVGIGRLDG